jgi:hypothetical protein
MGHMTTESTLDTTLEAIYASLNNNNEGLDGHIASLKALMKAQNMASVEVDATKLPQPNRQGRKLMQSYFKKRGVALSFAGVQA